MRSSSSTSIDAVARYAVSAPQSPALIVPDGITHSYSELWTQILEVGGKLDEVGVGVHDVVAVLIQQGALQVRAVAGVLNHSVCAPLQPRTMVSEVREILQNIGASAMITTSEFEVESEAASVMGLKVLIARNEQSPKDWEFRSPACQVQFPIPDHDGILILTTSATSGRAKQVPLTATNLDAQAEPRSRRLMLTCNDRLLQMTSLSHSMGIDNTLAQFSVGGAVIATGGFDSSAYVRWLDVLRPTWYDCAPTVHHAALVQLKVEPPLKPISLRFVQSAGAPLPHHVKEELEQVLRVPVFNDYGMTETGPIATDAFLPDGCVPNSVGHSCGLEIGIMDNVGDLLLPSEEGEIVVRGPAVFSSYTNNSKANLSAFRSGWFCTGDLGYLDSEGSLFVTGRLKEMINRGGEKIVPTEVEAVLNSHPTVLEAAAFPVPHPTLGEDIACAVVLSSESDVIVTTTELRRFASQHLATFKVPHRIYIVDEIPRGEQGKPQRWLLSERLSEKHAPPPSPNEMSVRRLADDVDDIFYKLHEIWARVLDRNDLGFDEDFFNAGGDSLAAINMLAEVDLRFSSHTSSLAASFFDDPTLVHLTGLVGKVPLPRPSQGTSNDIRIFPVRESGRGQKLFCIPADGDEGLYFRRLATHLPDEMNLSILRPSNTFYSQALFTFECAGSEMAAIIRQVQPEGPYLLGGFCYGGIVAVEAARKLLIQEQRVSIILFDVPMPGFPGPLGHCRAWIERARRKWRSIREGTAPEEDQSMSTPDPVRWYTPYFRRITKRLTWFTLNLSLTAHRLAWYAVLPFRRVLASNQNLEAIQRFLDWAQRGYFPFYRAKPLDARMLHFLCTDEPEMIDVLTRLGWRKVAKGGVDEQFVPYDHSNLLHESNLPMIARAIRELNNRLNQSDVLEST